MSDLRRKIDFILNILSKFIIKLFLVIAEPERVIKFRVQYPTFEKDGQVQLHTTTGYFK